MPLLVRLLVAAALYFSILKQPRISHNVVRRLNRIFSCGGKIIYRQILGLSGRSIVHLFLANHLILGSVIRTGIYSVLIHRGTSARN